MAAPVAPTTSPDAAGPAPLPGPKLTDIFGAEYPDPDAEGTVKAAYVEKLYQSGEADALARYRQATQNILYENGRQYIIWSNRRKEWADLPLEEGEIRVTINKIRPMLRARAQRMLSPQVKFAAEPDSNSYEARDKAKMARNFVQARFKQTSVDQKLDAGLNLAFCAGVSALKSFWNPAIGPLTPATKFLPLTRPALDPSTGEPVRDEQGQPVLEQGPVVEQYVDQTGAPLGPARTPDGAEIPPPPEAFRYRPGDTDTVLRTVFNIRINPDAHGWTTAEGLRWLVDSEVIPLERARATWPELATKIQPSAGATGLTYERIAAHSAVSRIGQGASAATAGSSPNQLLKDGVLVHEYWQLPDETFFPEGRTITIVGGLQAYDGPFPDGVFPYDPIYDEPAELTAYGRPSVNDMRSPQDVVNTQWTSIAQEMKQSGLGQWISWDVPGLDDQITSEGGAILKVPMRTGLGNRSISDVVHRIPPAQIGGDRWRMIDMAERALYDIGAYHEVTRGQIPPGLDSGVAITQLLEQEAGQLRRPMDALKRSLIGWAEKQTEIARRHYGDSPKRWVPADRPDMEFLIEGVRGVDLPEPGEIRFDLENWRPFSETAHRAEIKDLITSNILPPTLGLKLLDLGRGVEAAYESESRHYVRARHENVLIEQGAVVVQEGKPTRGPDGQVVPPPTRLVNAQTGEPLLLPLDDNHVLHMDVLDELILDPTKPQPVRQLAAMHKQEHRQAFQALNPPAPAPAPPPAKGARS